MKLLHSGVSLLGPCPPKLTKEEGTCTNEVVVVVLRFPISLCVVLFVEADTVVCWELSPIIEHVSVGRCVYDMRAFSLVHFSRRRRNVTSSQKNRACVRHQC
jgi:hypothetical protein